MPIPVTIPVLNLDPRCRVTQDLSHAESFVLYKYWHLDDDARGIFDVRRGGNGDMLVCLHVLKQLVSIAFGSEHWVI